MASSSQSSLPSDGPVAKELASAASVQAQQQQATAYSHSPTSPSSLLSSSLSSNTSSFSSASSSSSAACVRAPPVDIYDTPDSFRIVVALPGVPPTHISIDYQFPTHELVIKGEVPWQLPFGGSSATLSESITATTAAEPCTDMSLYREQDLKVRENWPVGAQFARRIKFPAHAKVDGSNVMADLKFGLVFIHVPKL